MSAETWIVLGALALAVAWGLAIHHDLRERRAQVTRAFDRLDAELSRRYQLVPRLVEAAGKVLGQAAATLDALGRAQDAAFAAAAAVRACPLDAAAVGMLAMAERSLEDALARVRVVARNCAQLDADGCTQALVEELTLLETRIDHARHAYNAQVLHYNDEASLFPAVVVARLCGFVPAATLLPPPRAPAPAPSVAY